MGQILIRNIDDGVIAALKRRAALHATSAEEEARRALSASVGSGDLDWKARAEALASQIGAATGPTSLDDLRIDRDRDASR